MSPVRYNCVDCAEGFTCATALMPHEARMRAVNTSSVQCYFE